MRSAAGQHHVQRFPPCRDPNYICHGHGRGRAVVSSHAVASGRSKRHRRGLECLPARRRQLTWGRSAAARASESTPPTCGPEHSRFSYSASLASFQGPRDPFEIVSGSGSMIQGQGAKGYADSGSGSYVLDPCDEAQTPGCSTGLKRYGRRVVRAGALRRRGPDGEGHSHTVRRCAHVQRLRRHWHPGRGVCPWRGELSAEPGWRPNHHRVPHEAREQRDLHIRRERHAHPAPGVERPDPEGAGAVIGHRRSSRALHGGRIVTAGEACHLHMGDEAVGPASMDLSRDEQDALVPLYVSGGRSLPKSGDCAGSRIAEASRFGGATPRGVRFPRWHEIATAHSVRTFTEEAWRITLRIASKLKRQELGFWINLNTCTLTYGHGPTILGPAVGPGDDGSVILGRRPADTPSNPGPVKGCATYPVASFHTHTPTKFRTVPNRRKVGPSTEDQNADKQDKVPGIVFDYIAYPRGGRTIPNGYEKQNPAIRYRSGLPVRPTPR